MVESGDRAHLRIGDVATRTGVSTRALRYYEEERLLPAERTLSGQRVYGESAIERVQLIQELYAAGLTSRSILELLPCVDTGHATPEMLEVLHVQRDQIARRMEDLERAQTQLDQIITRTREAGPNI